MAKIVTSARGEKIDFDLMNIKNAMASLPPTENVKNRERFINKKRRRGMKRRVDEMAQHKKLQDANFVAATTGDTPELPVDIVDQADSDSDTNNKRRKVK